MIDIIKAVQRKLGLVADGIPGNETWNAISAVLNVTVEKDPDTFFSNIKKLTGPLDQVQVDSINKLLSATAGWKTSWVAYALATAWHESRLRPIKEVGGDKYLSKYDTGKLALALGNTPEADGDGILYAGRGFVQLTGRTNYQNAGKFLGIDLLKYPDKALELDIAIKILVWGMEGGRYTGKALRDYIKSEQGSLNEFINARRIINGTDKATMIANYAVDFQNALIKGKMK